MTSNQIALVVEELKAAHTLQVRFAACCMPDKIQGHLDRAEALDAAIKHCGQLQTYGAFHPGSLQPSKEVAK